MDKRSLIAIALSLAVFMAWDYFYLSKQKDAPVQPAAVTQPAEKSAAPAAASSSVNVVAPQKTAGKEEKTSIDTATYSLVLSNKGGKIESLLYGSRKVELVNTSSPLTPSGFDFPIHFSEREFRSGSPIQDSFWTMTKKSEKDILFSIAASVSGTPVVIEKEFLFNEKEHYFDLVYRIKNTGRTAVQFENNSVIVSPADGLGPVMSDPTLGVNILSSVYNIAGSFKKGERGGGMFSDETATKSEKGKINWYGVISRYFTVLMIPQSEEKASGVIYDSKTEGSFRIGGFVSLESLQPNAAAEKKFRVCVAEKEKNILAAVDPGIVDATDVSKWTEPLRVGILWCLLQINKLFGNLGLSIIVLSIITKGIFLPLTIKSTNSMKKMSQLAPKMTEIKEKYKDNPEKIQKATMELYKKNGVNPMSGCLPILVQMPFFIALYSALSSSYALFGSPFCLWINDLSMPDSVYTFHAIGTSLSLNILPILMTITTYVQQKMSTMDTGSTGAQAVMMKMMPLLFIFMFWSMPSGLTLYWSVQNILQIAHQTYVNRVKKPNPVEE